LCVSCFSNVCLIDWICTLNVCLFGVYVCVLWKIVCKLLWHCSLNCVWDFSGGCLFRNLLIWNCMCTLNVYLFDVYVCELFKIVCNLFWHYSLKCVWDVTNGCLFRIVYWSKFSMYLKCLLLWCICMCALKNCV